MHKLILCCLIIVSFSCPLLSLPILNASEMSNHFSADEDSRLNMERLGTLGSTSLLQLLPELLGTLTEDSKAAGLTPSNYSPGENIKEKKQLSKGQFPASSVQAPVIFPHPKHRLHNIIRFVINHQTFYGNHPRIALLGRFLTKDRKQYKKRGNLSECFWKYCV